MSGYSKDPRTRLGLIALLAARRVKAEKLRLGVTGALIISGDAFVQTLEGDEAVVRDLYATIAADERHDQLTVLEESTAERAFGRWAMAQVGEDGAADIQLASNSSKGVIAAVARRDLGVTPEQDAVLATMRGAIALDTA